MTRSVSSFIISKPGFRRSLAGHLHEHVDAADLKHAYKLRNWLGMSEGRFLELFPEYNYPGLDGVYKGAHKAGEACFAQHKLSENPRQLRKAASQVDKHVRSQTELVVARGAEQEGD